MNTFTRPLVLLACALALAACSDSPEPDAPVDTPPPVTSGEVPSSATASTSAYVGFAQAQQASDNGLPLDVNGVTPPTSETDEPAAL